MRIKFEYDRLLSTSCDSIMIRATAVFNIKVQKNVRYGWKKAAFVKRR